LIEKFKKIFRRLPFDVGEDPGRMTTVAWEMTLYPCIRVSLPANHRPLTSQKVSLQMSLWCVGLHVGEMITCCTGQDLQMNSSMKFDEVEGVCGWELQGIYSIREHSLRCRMHCCQRKAKGSSPGLIHCIRQRTPVAGFFVEPHPLSHSTSMLNLQVTQSSSFRGMDR